MPIYTFKCEMCDNHKEVLQNMDDPPPSCDNCNELEMIKTYTSVGRAQFKGSGFYETDYKHHEDKKKKWMHNTKINMQKEPEGKRLDKIFNKKEHNKLVNNPKFKKRKGSGTY
tara:strand:+ start:203 stop:541 length:339 start_codon:yes stop_codon:yes gene_type:complete